MSTTATLLILWAAFAGSHMGLSSARLRPVLIERMGAGAFTSVYSLISLAIFIPLVSVYFGDKHSGPFLWYLGDLPGMRWFVYVGMGVAFAIMASGLARPSPASFLPGAADPSGVYRITRHPLFMGVALLGALHLLATPVNSADLAFFGGLAGFSLVGCRHQDRRKLATQGDDFRRFYDATPFLPGSRRGGLRGVAEQPLPMAIGVAVATVVRYYHANLFG